MLRVIASHNPVIIETFVRVLSMDKKESGPIATIYRRGETILVALEREISKDAVTWIASEFLPDRLYIPFFGYSVDMIHEVGDIIVPNVFFTYTDAIEKTEITKENRDSFHDGARFLELFREQKDYYVEDYGLSIGGIITGLSPSVDRIDSQKDRLMLVYESDIYTTDSLEMSLDVMSGEDIPTMIVSGVTTGRPHPKYQNVDPLTLVVKNMMTTIELMEDDARE